MTKKDVLLVLPKLSAYELKSQAEKDNIEKTVKQYVEYIHSLGKQVNCFAQDFLAVKLLAKADVVWLNVMGNADLLFTQESMDDVPVEYKRLLLTAIPREVIDEAIKQHKLRKPVARDSAETYAKERTTVVQRRIRYACNSMIAKHTSFVIYVNANNNFCNEPGHEAGDSLCSITCDVITGLERCYYSGLPMDSEVFKEVMRGEA